MAEETGEKPGTCLGCASFAPIVVPVVLIALKSVADYPTNPLGAGSRNSSFVGEPQCSSFDWVFLAFLTGAARRGDGDWVSGG